MKNIQDFNDFINESNNINEGRVPGKRHPDSSGRDLLRGDKSKSAKELKKFTTVSGKKKFYFYNATEDGYDLNFFRVMEEGIGYAQSLKVQMNSEDGIPIIITFAVNEDYKKLQVDPRWDKKVLIPEELFMSFYYSNGKDAVKAFGIIMERFFNDNKNYLSERESTESKGIKAHVLSIGNINIQTGKTAHGWSIYDNPEMRVYLCNHRLLYASPDTFNVDDKVTLVGNDNGRRLDLLTVNDSSPCIKEDVIKMLLKYGFDYRKLAPFKKKSSNVKLASSYSVKGTEYLYTK